MARGPNGELLLVGTSGAVGTQVIYGALSLPQLIPDLFAVQVTGGITTLAADPDYDFLGDVVGTRAIYHRCAILPNSVVGQCDLYSVQSDGSGTIALSTNPNNDMVQGVIGERVIVRRNQQGFDTLYSITADGSGGETAILTLSVQDDFVIGTVETHIILKRANGLWSVRADGTTIVQLTPSPEPNTFSAHAAGSFACFERGPSSQRDLWCVPSDGSAPASPLATSQADETFVTCF